MKNIIKEAEKIVDKILDNMISIHEDVTMNDIKGLVKKLKQRGFRDTGKIQGALNKANSIAKSKGKAGNKAVVAGIMSRFFRGK